MLPHALCFVLLVHFILFTTATEVCPQKPKNQIHDEAKLLKDLLSSGYDSAIRPVKSHKDTVTVKIRFHVKYLSFDSLEETITVHSWIAISWNDYMLTWCPADYGNIEEIQIESHEIWTPRMSLFNADATYFQSDSFYSTCLVVYNGTVVCVPPVTHSGMCNTKLTNWPYDVQNCSLYFGAWMHSGEQVNFTFAKDPAVSLDDFQNGPGWHLKTVTNRRYSNPLGNKTYPMLKYTFVLEREAAGPAAVVVVPSVVIVLLTLASLLLDINSNIRLMLVCFSLYGHFLFLSEIGYDIPKHSSDTPIILLFIRDSMIVTLVGVLMTLVMMSLRRRVEPPPNWLVTVTRLATKGPGKYAVFTEFEPSDVERKTLTEGGTAVSTTEDSKHHTDEWIQLANLLNSCYFIISVLLYLILLAVYMPRVK